MAHLRQLRRGAHRQAKELYAGEELAKKAKQEVVEEGLT